MKHFKELKPPAKKVLSAIEQKVGRLASIGERKILKSGDKFTIKGMRCKKDGTYTTRCKPGNETIFKVIK